MVVAFRDVFGSAAALIAAASVLSACTLQDPATIHPKQVTATARDTLAKSYDVTLPWKQ